MAFIDLQARKKAIAHFGTYVRSPNGYTKNIVV
jgi:hypothetical protein